MDKRIQIEEIEYKIKAAEEKKKNAVILMIVSGSMLIILGITGKRNRV